MTWTEVLILLKSSTKFEQINEKREEIAGWIPAIRIMFDYDQNSNYHQYDLWMHSVYTVLEIPKEIDDDMLYLAALLHDIGKPNCRCEGHKEGDIWSHYYGHPDVSEKIVSEQVIPHLFAMGEHLLFDDMRRLLYYIKYHDDRISLRLKHLRRHLKLVDIDTFKKLMLLEVADAKAHVMYPKIKERIEICSEWVNGRADELKQQLDGKES